MNTQRLILDLDKSSVPRGRVTIAQCDHDGTTVEAEIYDNGVALDTSGLSAYLVMRLPDGRHYYRVPATLDGHVATALVDEAYAATATGTTEIAYFELVGSGGVVYSTSRFGVRVLPSATADATVPETWDGEVERLIQQLDDAIETATDAANVANAAAANADVTADGVESRVQEMAQDAAETATADAEQRIQDAIDAMGDISELAVPLMSADVRGGARLEEHGGLVLRDEKLGIGSLVQESDGTVRGGIAELTAKGHAEQASTTGKNLLNITATSQTILGVTFTVNANGSVTCNGTATGISQLALNRFAQTGSFILSGCPAGGSYTTYDLRTDSEIVGGSAAIDLGDGATFERTDGLDATQILITIRSGYTCNNLTFYPMVEAGSTKTAYEPYSGGLPSPRPDWEQPIEVVRGRNLFDIESYPITQGVYIHSSSGASINDNDLAATLDFIPCEGLRGKTITLNKRPGFSGPGIAFYDSTKRYISGIANGGATANTPLTFTVHIYATYMRFTVPKSATDIQLTLGSTPQPYVPYGHVGMEARDPDTDELISCTALPLPSRGWVGSLPDGTADVLTLDGAGKCEWELRGAETTTAATDGVTGTVGVDVLSTTGQIADGATVLYKLATPVTEDCGYVDDWPTDIPEGAVISIPELDAVNIEYFIDSTVTVLAKQWYARANSEYADRITALEQAVAELATS